jgi:hypothetical protein
MRRKALGAIALVTLVGVVGAAVALASSGGELTKPETIHVTAKGGRITFLPVNTAKHDFTGDEVVVNAPVFTPNLAAKRGFLHAVCTLVEPKGIVGECDINTFLRGGQIAVRGPLHFGKNDRTVGVVTGGSGRFRNARGQVVFLNSTGNTEGLVFQLEP